MHKIMDRLLTVQKLQFDARAQTAASKAEAEKLRAEVPPPILAHYDRLAVRGKKGVALVRNGVCSECHLRLTGAKVIGLSAAPNEIHLCDNCGRYLHLPETPTALPDATPPPTTEVKVKRTRTSKKAVPHVG